MDKVCKKCLLPKEINLFHKRKIGSIDGHFHHCKACHKNYNEKWLKLNKERDNLRRNRNYKNKKIKNNIPTLTQKEHEEALKAYLH